jgi:hypothetical protein
MLSWFLAISLASYIGLRYVLRHPERFVWLGRDSSKGLRESVGYKRLAGLTARLVPVITGLIFVYLAIGFLAGVVHGDGGTPWQLITLLLLGAVAVLLITRSLTNPYLLAMLYFVGLAVTLEVESHAGMLLVAGLSMKQITNGILLLIALIASLKIAMRQDGEFFLGSIDILLLGLSILFAVTLHSFDVSDPLAGAFIKGIVLFIGVKVVTVTSYRQARGIVLGMLVVFGGIIIGGVV